MNLKSNDNSKWYESLDDAKKDSLWPIKCTTVLQFYKLGTTMTVDTKEKVKQYASDLIQRSIEMGRDNPLSQAAATQAAREHFGQVEGDNSVEITRGNFYPITYLQYVVFSATENRYYLKAFPNYPIEEFYFYKYSTNIPDTEAQDTLRDRIYDGTVTLLFNKHQITEMTASLVKLWSHHFKGEGKIDYLNYLSIADATLVYEDYKIYNANGTGFKTACKVMEDKINQLWQDAYDKYQLTLKK